MPPPPFLLLLLLMCMFASDLPSERDACVGAPHPPAVHARLLNPQLPPACPDRMAFHACLPAFLLCPEPEILLALSLPPASPSCLPRNYQHIPVTSVSLPVDPGGHYTSFPHFVGFSERIKFVGGINKPKIVTVTDSEGTQCRQLVRRGGAPGMGGNGGKERLCVCTVADSAWNVPRRSMGGSKGRYQQVRPASKHALPPSPPSAPHLPSVRLPPPFLDHMRVCVCRPRRSVCAAVQVKSGNDDLRQDAVMQQFFWLVNQFLREQPRTQRRSLFIRTYKVGGGEEGGEKGVGCCRVWVVKHGTAKTG